MILLSPPLLCLLIVLLLPLHPRRPFALAAFLSFLAVGAWHGLLEYARLAPFVDQRGLTWSHVLGFCDALVVGGLSLGFAATAGTVRLSVVASKPVRRARNKAPEG